MCSYSQNEDASRRSELHAAELHAAELHAAELHTAELHTTELRPAIAIVDDDESVRTSLVRLCRSEGFCADSYHSADAFLDAKRTEGTACLILDYQMPGKNGLELQRELLASGRRIPVVMISGDENEFVRKQALEVGAIAFLPKPTGSQQLLEVVRQAIKTGKAD